METSKKCDCTTPCTICKCSSDISTELTLNTLLKLNNLTKIESVKDLFDTTILDEDKMPKILTKKATVIIFDNSIFNSTYLIDIYNSFINDNQISDTPINISNIDVFYCDSLRERLRISCCNKIFNFANLSLIDINNIEKQYLKPSIIFINPNLNHIGIIEESFITFNVGNMKDLFKLVEENRNSKAWSKEFKPQKN